MHLIYVDDSGDENRLLFSGLAIPEHRWSSYLKGWLTWRKQLFRDHGVPADYELHCQDWLSASPAPLADGSRPDVLRKDKNGRRARFQLFSGALRVIGTFEEASLFTVATASTTDESKYGLYASLLEWLETELLLESAFGLVVLDGGDPGHKFRRRHRELSIKTRRIIEDPQPCPSHESQLIQMADWCVHAAFRHLRASDAHDDLRTIALYPLALEKLIVSGAEDDNPNGVKWVH